MRKRIPQQRQWLPPPASVSTRSLWLLAVRSDRSPFSLALNRDLTDFHFGKVIVCGRLPIFKTTHADGAWRPGALVALTGLRMCARS
jgi:hypothetical protein